MHLYCPHKFILNHQNYEDKRRAKLVDLKRFQEDYLVFSDCYVPVCSFRHQYQPLSLRRLQYLIDLGRVDPTQPIDLTQLVNGRGVTIQPLKRDYGVQLVEEVTLDLLLLLGIM